MSAGPQQARNDRRQSSGIEALDACLGGGFIPGTLTVVVGTTGIGKTQLGLQFANAGMCQEGRHGAIVDLSARGDSQNHRQYAASLFGWDIKVSDSQRKPTLEHFFADADNWGDYLHVFDYRGQRVTRRDLDWEQWHDWQSQLNRKLQSTISFLYGNSVNGMRRVVIDGIEPTDRPGESIQYNLVEYIYHQVLRKDPEWVARDLFREKFRENWDTIRQQTYEPSDIGCLLLCTSHETMLDDLIARPLDEGDAISNANTLILMGKVRHENRMGRALYVAKHRGSYCRDEIIPYEITSDGLVFG